MKFGASAKSFLAFLCLFAIMMALTAYSSPAAYIAASTSLSIADRLLNISCMDLAARLLKFPAEHGSLIAANSLGRYYYFGMGVPQSYTLSRKYLTIAANQGDADAQQLLAYMTSFGTEDNTVDYQQVEKWLQKSASQGLSDSQFLLSEIYFSGAAGKKDPVQAFTFCAEAAAHGHPAAAASLANYYQYGIGTKKDDALATKYWRKAAEQGVSRAQYNFAIRLFNGLGCQCDPKEALHWLDRSATHGYGDALLALGQINRFKQFEQSDMSMARRCLARAAALGSSSATYLKSAPLKTLKEIEQAAQGGDPHAQAVLAGQYWTGVARKYSPDKAQPLYRAAATGGDADAQLWQATMNFDGLDNGNFSAATRWAEKSASSGNSSAYFLLADFAEYGTGMKADPHRRAQYLETAANLGNPDAESRLGTCYDRGYGVKPNQELARKWLTAAAQEGNIWAQNRLADLIMRTVKQDAFRDADKWRRLAAEQGDRSAMLSVTLSNGIGLTNKLDQATASEYLKKLEESADVDTDETLSHQYSLGFLGVKADKVKAHAFLKRAAEAGLVSAQLSLGDAYRFGFNTDKNAKEACLWYHKAAEQGSLEARKKIKKYCQPQKGDKEPSN